MPSIRQATALLSFAALWCGAHPAAAQFYLQHNLVSDLPGVADLQDSSLVNSWGLTSSSTSPWWVANNATGTSTLYDTSAGGPGVTKRSLTVTIPGGVPTGTVFNCGTGFKVTDATTGATGSALFIFAGEDGSISGWSPAVPPPPTSTKATIAIQPSDKVYKGLAIACTTPGGDFLYATDFHNGKVDKYDNSFVLQPNAFVDPKIPKGYAPFGIQNVGGIIYVTYALQDADAHDDVRGMGHGFVNEFTTDGMLIRRVASRETLNSPWGLAMAPANFGKFSGDLLIGNFGDGKIHAYDPNALLGNGEFKRRGVLHSAGGPPLKIDGLWALQFGNGVAAGPKTTLFFTAGPQDESHGLFGSLVATTPPKDDQDDDQDEDD
ncbi:MAG TPA: TIGR03118 family protein [Casimicrobiaceae bacterium]|nr:TIGR03118 family protein [Casimicrobiaceae bacterium]